jgi:hypothetical protein
MDSFAEGNDATLDILQSGSFVVDAGTAIRFYSRVEETYKVRKKRWLEKFQKSFEISNIRRIDDFEIALRNGKQNLMPIYKFVSLPGFPEDLKKLLLQDLVDFVTEIKNTLKKNVSKVSAERDKMMILLSSFELPLMQISGITQTTSNNSVNTSQTSNGRKIIF